MLRTLAATWPLLLGLMLLMVGNGVQGSLLGIRGALEGFSTFHLSVVMSAYFAGFLGGSRLAPRLIRRVGHVRVFAALGSMISAILVLYPLALDWVAWSALRVVIGFCFAGIYVTTESWLNAMATNETRGQALSAYMIVQMLGIIASQVLFGFGDPEGFALFIIPSVLVSLAFMPLLLADLPAPEFEDTRPMPFRRLFRISPLGCAGMLLTGGIFSAMFGMASVWGAMRALTVGQIAGYVGALYVGGLLFQYPVGWLSDRIDRRQLVLALSTLGALTMLAAFAVKLPYPALLVVAAILGGMINPLYSLLIAHTNDFLGREEMAAASSGMLFLNGFGAVFGPLVAGWVMHVVGSAGYFLFIGLLFAALAAYTAWRMRRRVGPSETGGYAGLAPLAQSVAVEAVLDQQARPAQPSDKAA
ncbi:MFS transporter [Neotabrizicola shimadae]|uniref:MFS transporter n=1 Tax=Neotabrizicola shimadae TaxID=2807096 RepID=A0A8G1ED81_9RHOB|nr:MFS transporter [Neotabrizicola shimadae]QYZ71395.1 MFS transporter [Neotabrizicola shimadae]